tara:strand:+ start:26653 stop:28554 length:1902 start_codon:yes stop_codon:yes gene_type:complete
MAFTPASPLNLVFKKYTSIPAPSQITVDVPLNTDLILKTSSLPTWLTFLNQSFNGTTGTFYFKVLLNAANALTPGTHSATVNLQSVNYDVRPNVVEDLGNYTVNLLVEDTIILEVSPTILSYSFNVGDGNPATKAVQITSENNWNLTTPDSWITLSANSGSQNATVHIGVDPSALANGNYTGTVTVDDGIFTRTIVVYLSVSDPSTVESYLFLNPQNFEFLSQQGDVNTTQKSLSIDAGDAWSAQISETWLVMSAENGTDGITDVYLSVDSGSLSVGVYQAQIEITSNGIIKKVYVTLRVVSFVSSGLTNNTLYYADDRNKLQVGNVVDNTFLRLAVEASAVDETFNYEITSPYFRGVASVLIGSETDKLIPSFIPSNDFTTRIMNNIQPVVIGLSAFDEQYFTGLTTAITTYYGLRFLKGETPTTNGRLSYIPKNIKVSNLAVVRLSVLSLNAPGAATITGAVTATVNGGSQNGLYVYTLLLNLADYALEHKDEIRVSFGGHVVNVFIDNDYLALNTIAFENEWGEYELFETRGYITQYATVSPTYQEKAYDGLSHTRVLEAHQDAEFIIDTGYIQTTDEVEWLSRMLNSKRTFLYLNGEPEEVIFTTKKMQVSKTRNHIRSFSLNFKKAIK